MPDIPETTLTPTIGSTIRPEDLAVVLRLKRDGPEIDREPVNAADMGDIFSELWFDGTLRRGDPNTPIESLTLRVTPTFGKQDDTRCATFTLEAVDPSGNCTCREYSLEAFQDVADRASRRLLADGRLKANDLYYYEVVVDARGAVGSQSDPALFAVTAKNPPLEYRTTSLAPLLARSRVVGNLDDRSYPVFITEEALADAERYARMGAGKNPPVETGAVLIGPLCSCPDTGEMFSVVRDVLEVRDAEGSSFSLAYTAQTWRQIQAIMRAKQSEQSTRADRILGQTHGHNFGPDFKAGEEHGSCQTCPKRGTCQLTSSFVSHDDRVWSRAVFSRQPWQLALIFGYDARNRPTHALFGLRDNRLIQRGYRVLSDFDLEDD